MKIGDAIQTIRRSEGERERIKNSIINGIGKPFEIFNTYSVSIRDQPVWLNAHKRLKVKGFRPGKANNLIVSRVTQGIHDNDKKVEPVFWSLYISSVVDYLNKEHSNLNRLLLEKEIEGDSNSTDNIVKEIMKYIALYEVETDEIEELYELWWFERTEKLYELFSHQVLSVSVVKEIVSKSEKQRLKELENLNKKVDKLELALDKQDSKHGLEKDLKKMGLRLDDLRSDFELESARFEKKYLESLDGKIAEIEGKIDKEKDADSGDINPELKTKISENEKNINSLNYKIEKLIAVKKEKEKSINRDGKLFKSSKTLRENVSKLFENHNFDEVHAELLRLILNTFNCFYVESDIFFRAIVQEVLQASGVREIIATPSLIDISPELFLEVEENDLIYVKNINSCFIDGFAIPLLLKSSSLIDKNFPKVFILHDSEVNSAALSKIKRHTLEISSEWLLSLRDIEILSPIGNIDLSEIEEISESHKEFQRIFSNIGIEIDRQVFENFVRLSQVLKPFVGEEQSIYHSAGVAVFQYVRCCYGETKSQVAIDLIKGEFAS